MKPTVLISGASGSMGAAATESLAAEGWRVIMACRNAAKGSGVRDSVLARHPDAEIELRQVDFASLDSVRDFAAGLPDTHIDVLFNNAGTICRDWELTADGFEKTFQVNFLGPALLTALLASRVGKVVTMVSLTCGLTRIPPGYTGDSGKEFSQLGTYARAKLAMLLFTLEAGKRHGIPVALADPGIVNSNMISMGRWFDPLADLLFRPLCSSPRKGVSPALRAIRESSALKPDLQGKTAGQVSGQLEEARYYVGHKVQKVPCRYLEALNGPELLNFVTTFENSRI